MISLGRNYDSVKGIQTGEYHRLPPDGYVCKVLDAVESRTKTGKPLLVLTLDIAEGKYKDFFKGNLDKAPKMFQLIYSKDGSISPFFKGLLTNFERSNPTLKVVGDYFDEKILVGMFIGVIFGEEDFIYNDEVKTAVKPQYSLAIDRVRDKRFTIPPRRKIERRSPISSKLDEDFGDVEIKDEQLPF